MLALCVILRRCGWRCRGATETTTREQLSYPADEKFSATNNFITHEQSNYKNNDGADNSFSLLLLLLLLLYSKQKCTSEGFDLIVVVVVLLLLVGSCGFNFEIIGDAIMVVESLAITEEWKKKRNYKIKKKIYAGAIKMYAKAIESYPCLVTQEDVLCWRDIFDNNPGDPPMKSKRRYRCQKSVISRCIEMEHGYGICLC